MAETDRVLNFSFLEPAVEEEDQRQQLLPEGLEEMEDFTEEVVAVDLPH
jgi:hypothetical protein